MPHGQMKVLCRKNYINIGIAVSLEDGLIVPVIKDADKKGLLQLSKDIQDIALRARDKKLNLEDVQGGTFTITNYGLNGSLFGTPVILLPQVAILGVGAVVKRPVVIDDAIAIRSMMYLSLSFDHRVMDGANADVFLHKVKDILEGWEGSVYENENAFSSNWVWWGMVVNHGGIRLPSVAAFKLPLLVGRAPRLSS